jgi:ubiquinone/menaquinone biosynthesis C-methylase UbiE
VARYIEVLEDPERLAELKIPDVVAALGLPDDAIVADVGCGPGAFSVAFARACPRGVVYAADVEPRQLDALRAKLLAQSIDNVVPVLASFEDPHLPPGRVDLIFVCDTYHHLQDRVAYLQGLARDLAPDGRLAFVEYRSGELPVGPPADHKLPAGVRQRELAEAGFVPELKMDLHEWHDFDVWSLAP